MREKPLSLRQAVANVRQFSGGPAAASAPGSLPAGTRPILTESPWPERLATAADQFTAANARRLGTASVAESTIPPSRPAEPAAAAPGGPPPGWPAGATPPVHPLHGRHGWPRLSYRLFQVVAMAPTGVVLGFAVAVGVGGISVPSFVAGLCAFALTVGLSFGVLTLEQWESSPPPPAAPWVPPLLLPKHGLA